MKESNYLGLLGLLTGMVLTSVPGFGQTSSETGAEEGVSLEAKPSAPTTSDLSVLFKEERDKILNRLKNDVEPNLIKADIQKLNGNVKRLGSYRRDWVLSAQEFLVANSNLAELYIYRYFPLKNMRLNRVGLRTLLLFPSFREIKAPLAFLNVFVDDPEQTLLAIQLLGRMVEQDPKIASEAVEALNGPLGERVSLESKLQFGIKACPKLPSPGTMYKEILKSWKSRASSFWELVLADELDPCLKGV
jgi:hypothetical protein